MLCRQEKVQCDGEGTSRIGDEAARCSSQILVQLEPQEAYRNHHASINQDY